jgi:hypothetical protein
MDSIKPSNKIGLIARILSVPILLFTLFTVFAHIIWPDTEPGSYDPVENWLPVLMSASVLGLAVAWRWEFIGGVVTVFFFIAHLLAYWIIREIFFPLNVLVLFTPVLVTGVLFIISSRKSEV